MHAYKYLVSHLKNIKIHITNIISLQNWRKNNISVENTYCMVVDLACCESNLMFNP
jgi:hypothetical protein